MKVVVKVMQVALVPPAPGGANLLEPEMVMVICQGDINLNFKTDAATAPSPGDLFEVSLSKLANLGPRVNVAPSS